jgi:hypothetical protein
MRRIPRSTAVLFFALLTGIPVVVSAQRIATVNVAPPQLVPRQPIEISISFAGSTANLYCGLVVSFGDGNEREIRVAEKDVPVRISHQYMAAGTYTISAKGKLLVRGLRTATACEGNPQLVQVAVVQASPGSAATAGQLSAPDDAATLQRAATGGDTDAMYRLGNLLANRGENAEAVRWFRSAAESGHVKATNALGFMYEEGRGVPQNYREAHSLYFAAIKKRDPDAMVNRGLMFAKGLGVAADQLQAYVHFLLAAAYAKDNETRTEAVRLRDEAAGKLSPPQINQGQALADKFAREELEGTANRPSGDREDPRRGGQRP